MNEKKISSDINSIALNSSEKRNPKEEKIIISDLIKIYKRKNIETSALRGLSCTFNKGEISVIMGPSGCGKTTLLNIIGGISRTSGGLVTVFGQAIPQFSEKELEEYRRNKISYIFQQNNLIPTMTVEENITFPLEYANQLSPTTQTSIKNIIDFIEIEDNMKKYPDELSGGEQQRVALASALVKNTPIILCDEPTGELDTESKLKVMNLIAWIKKQYPEKIIIVVTHDADFKLIADRVLYIRDGKISFEMSEKELQSLKSLSDRSPDAISYQALSDTNDDEMIIELRELAKNINDKMQFYENRKAQRKEILFQK